MDRNKKYSGSSLRCYFSRNAVDVSNLNDMKKLELNISNYVKEAMKAINIIMNSQTDISLEVKHKTFYVHREVLAASCPYFKTMFTCGLKECHMQNIRLKGVSAAAMAELIHFIYTEKIRVNEKTVCKILPAATMLQITKVTKMCCDFLAKQVDPSNAIGIASFVEHYGYLELCKNVIQYIERHFSQICQEEEFLQLNVDQLIALIEKDDLNVPDEKEVYNSVLAWVKSNEKTRQKKLEQLLSLVRCHLLSPKFLEDQMTKCEIIKNSPACVEYLCKIFKDLTSHIPTVVKERIPNLPQIIYIAGGNRRYSLNCVEGYSIDYKNWNRLGNLLTPRSGLGGVYLKRTFYVVGGRNNSYGRDLDCLDAYNSIKDQWTPCSSMSVPRNQLGVAVMDGLLYAVGGSDHSKFIPKVHKSVECYNPDLGRWANIPPMHFKRRGAGVAVINRHLYVIGGYNCIKRHKSVECYHPENESWTMVASMHTRRSRAGVCAINQYIYVVGGCHGFKQLNSVERYDTENDVWELVSSMKIARCALSVTVIDGKIHAMGGYNEHGVLASVEIYDPIRDLWEDGQPLSFGRSGHTSVVCYKPS